ncbi:MAG TPA: helix-turn-helix domain-containing protein [Isosphaeraceae bacterium]|jgi:transposase
MSRDQLDQWLHRFNAEGLACLRDRPRKGRPPIYSPEQVAEVVAAALTDPKDLGLGYGCWMLDRTQGPRRVNGGGTA